MYMFIESLKGPRRPIQTLFQIRNTKISEAQNTYQKAFGKA